MMDEAPLAPYEVLGVSPTASIEEVTAAYKVLAQIYHPDRYAESSEDVQRASEARMRALNTAYKEAQNGRLAVHPVANGNGRSGRRGGRATKSGVPTRVYRPGVPWDIAVKARAAAAVKAEQDRRAKEQSKPQGYAVARPRPMFGGPVLTGLGMARFTNNVVCKGCQSVMWLPDDWQNRLDAYAFYCSKCDRLIFTR